MNQKLSGTMISYDIIDGQNRCPLARLENLKKA